MGWGGCPRTFYKKSKLYMSLDQQSEMFVFNVCLSRGLPK